MPSFQTISSVERLPHAHPDRADYLAFDGDRIQSTAAVVRGPDFVDRDFTRLFIDADFGDLRGVGICRRRPDPRALVLAAARFLRRRIRTTAGERPVKIDRSDHGFFEGHCILRTFVFALLLERAAKDLAFYAAG